MRCPADRPDREGDRVGQPEAALIAPAEVRRGSVRDERGRARRAEHLAEAPHDDRDRHPDPRQERCRTPPKPRPVRRTPRAIIWSPRIPHRDRRHPELEDGDEDAVRALQEAVHAVGEAQVADPERERRVPLRVDEPAGEDGREGQQEAFVGEDRRAARRRSPGPACFVVRVPWGSATSEITPNAAEVTASAMNRSVEMSRRAGRRVRVRPRTRG